MSRACFDGGYGGESQLCRGEGSFGLAGCRTDGGTWGQVIEVEDWGGVNEVMVRGTGIDNGSCAVVG